MNEILMENKNMKTIVQEMGLAAVAYKGNGYANKSQASTIVLGFIWQLKNWWDNYLIRD